MGNQSAKNRHTSGDDTAPTLTTGRYYDSSSGVSFASEQEIPEPASCRVSAKQFSCKFRSRFHTSVRSCNLSLPHGIKWFLLLWKYGHKVFAWMYIAVDIGCSNGTAVRTGSCTATLLWQRLLIVDMCMTSHFYHMARSRTLPSMTAFCWCLPSGIKKIRQRVMKECTGVFLKRRETERSIWDFGLDTWVKEEMEEPSKRSFIRRLVEQVGRWISLSMTLSITTSLKRRKQMWLLLCLFCRAFTLLCVFLLIAGQMYILEKNAAFSSLTQWQGRCQWHRINFLKLQTLIVPFLCTHESHCCFDRSIQKNSLCHYSLWGIKPWSANGLHCEVTVWWWCLFSRMEGLWGRLD